MHCTTFPASSRNRHENISVHLCFKHTYLCSSLSLLPHSMVGGGHDNGMCAAPAGRGQPQIKLVSFSLPLSLQRQRPWQLSSPKPSQHKAGEKKGPSGRDGMLARMAATFLNSEHPCTTSHQKFYPMPCPADNFPTH